MKFEFTAINIKSFRFTSKLDDFWCFPKKILVSLFVSNKLLQKEMQTKLQQKKLKTNEIKHFNFKKNIDCLTVKTFSPSFVDVEYVAYTKAAE